MRNRVTLSMCVKIVNAFLVFLLLGCCSCHSPSPHNNPHVLRLNIHHEPPTMDPRKARDLTSITLAKMVFEGLTRLDQEGKVELALAEKVTISEDLKTFTFTLRESYWTNGDPVTAQDFAYAWKTCLTPEFPSDTAFQMYGIRHAKLAKEGKVSLDEVGIWPLDDKTLRVELEHPTPYFLHLLAAPPFLPVNSKIDQSNTHWAENSADFVSNGPFSLHTWKHNDSITVEKSGKYWDADQVRLAGLELIMVKEGTELMLFEKGELDWAGAPLSTLPLEAIPTLRRQGILQIKEMLGTYFLRTNTYKFPFNHPKIRLAFALAIDRRAIVAHITQGNQIPATGLVPTALGLRETPYFPDNDVIKARMLIEEALTEMGITQESLPPLFLLYRSGERSHLIAQAIQQQWLKALGIHVTLEAVEGKVYFNRISHQDYQLAACDWIADFEDPINFLEVFKYKNGGSNNTLWENAEYIRLLDASSHTLDPTQRKELLSASEAILMEEMPIIPLFHYTMLYINRPEVKEVFLSNSGQLDFKWAYFDKGDQEKIHKEKLR